MQATAIVTVIAITLGTVGALLLARNARNIALREGPVSGTRLSSPIPNPTPVDRIPMPTSAQLSAPSDRVAWVLVAGNVLFRSTDKGTTWEKRSLPNVGDGGLEVSFVDQLQGWSVHRRANETDCSGAGVDVWHTTDGGGNWEPIAPVQWTMPKDAGIGYAQCKDGLSFIKAALGFLGASDPDHRPTIYRTLDGGKTWLGSTLSDPPDFKTSPGFALRVGRVKLLGNTLYVVASGLQGGDSRQYMFRSTDGGATWSWLIKIPSPYIAMVTESRWLQLVVPGMSMESINSGQQWHPYESDFNTTTPVGGPQVVFADSQVGYAEGRGVLQRTVDGGLHWTRIATPGTALTTSCPAANGWLTYTSAKWGYSLDYPSNWCKLGNFGAPEIEQYFSNEQVSNPKEMSMATGIWLTVNVVSGACPAPPPGERIDGRDVVKVEGQDVTRTYGFSQGYTEPSYWFIRAAIAHGPNCYSFLFITRTKEPRDGNLPIADKMISSFVLGSSPTPSPVALLPVTDPGFTCSVPAYSVARDGQLIGGFVSFPGGSFKADPAAALVVANGMEVHTVAQPVLKGTVGLSFDASFSRWVPASPEVFSSDGSEYAWTERNVAPYRLHITRVVDGTDRSFAVEKPLDSDHYGSIPVPLGLTKDGVFLTYGWEGEWGVWRLDLASGSLTKITGLPSPSYGAGAIWLELQRGPNRVGMYSDGDTLARLDPKSGVVQDWFHRDSAVVRHLGFDQDGNPWVKAMTFRSMDPHVLEIWRVRAPGQPELILSDQNISRVITDKHGTWFANETGTYLFSGGRLQRVSSASVSEVVGPCM